MKRIVIWLLVGVLAGAPPAAAQNPGNFSQLFIGPSATPVRFLAGSGSPNSVVTARVGSWYVDLGVAIYYKATGTGNTGWVVLPASIGPADSTYITQTCNATLSAEQCISALSTGFLYGTTTTGVVSSVGETGTGNVVRQTSGELFTPKVSVSDAVTAAVSDALTVNHLSSGTPAADFGTGLIFKGKSSTTAEREMARIQSVWKTATDASRASMLQFQTLTAAGALATSMTIDDVGNIGIGTTNPFAKLHVSSGRVRIHSPAADDIALHFVDSRDLGSLFFQTKAIGGSAGSGYAIYSNTELPLTLGANNTEHVRITAGGNVGIGTTAPGQKLDVAGSIALGLNTGSANNLAWSATAPTISSGFGTSPSVTAGTSAAFRVNVGTGGTATGGVLGMPTAAAGWNCGVTNLTQTAGNRANQWTVQTASTTNTVTVQHQTISTGAALAWTASDVLAVTCTAY